MELYLEYGWVLIQVDSEGNGTLKEFHAFIVSHDVRYGFVNNLELQLCFQFRRPYVTVLIKLPLFLAEEGSKVVEIPWKIKPPKSGESDSRIKVQKANAIIFHTQASAFNLWSLGIYVICLFCFMYFRSQDYQ